MLKGGKNLVSRSGYEFLHW